jgi:hypothetical protein
MRYDAKFVEIKWWMTLLLLNLFHEFHKELLVNKTYELAIAKDTNIPQAQFHEALIDQVYGGVNIQSNRRLYTSLVLLD